ncbi:DUF3280 domain-containing protein [Methylogaea oryzae]|uniref:DUF2380 domain-containing protein n=1 Tax=Methylogaea oryzae TaxID=1295382 RepID=A0A8D4VNP2_9GAMM|nr:DUF3280 domain-containing protein [Methylogaea oryzae]BBL71223.1 hypothetical protein MoryE10_18290 [Methylogaea oryzae]
MPCFNTLRRLGIVAAFVMAAIAARADDTPLSDIPLAVLDLAYTGDTGDARRREEWRARLADMTTVLREEIGRSRLYPLVDHGPIPVLTEQWKTMPYWHACNGCELDIARRVGAGRVLVGWVFRMSNLVLTLHIEIRDAASGRTLVKRAYDFRGDNDTAWRRAIAYFIKDMRERPPGGA